jgi:putative IMPACT (imprinted ancient) family translation regulator
MSKYKTIQGESLGEYREKGSKFLAYAFPIQNESDVAPVSYTHLTLQTKP